MRKHVRAGVVALLLTLWAFPASAQIKSWSAGPSLPVPLSQTAAAGGAGGDVYLFGGLTPPSSPTNTTWKYDPDAGTFRPRAAMPFANYGACAASMTDGRILVTGGINAQTLVYDPQLDSWGFAANAGIGWKCAAVAAPDGTVHVFGGGASPNHRNVYNPLTNSWATTGLPIPRQQHGAAIADDGRFYVFGGYQSPNTLSIFNPAASSWSMGPSMPGGNLQFAHAADGRDIYVIGGSYQYSNNEPPFFNHVWRYSTATGMWSADSAPLLLGVREAEAVIVDGVVHVFGGSNGVPTAAHQQGILACGDGVPDPGEECDDGAANGTTESCCSLHCEAVEAGSGCDDGDACSATSQCDGAGTCVGSDYTQCVPLDPCHLAGTCDPDTGECDDPAKDDGSACSDGDACSLDDTCQSGACQPGGSTLAMPVTNVEQTVECVLQSVEQTLP